MYKKTVIHVFTNNCCNIKYNPYNIASYWGLGDLIRGSIKLYQFSQIMKFNYYIDISLHPISKYLINSDHPYKQLVQDNKDNIEYYYIDYLKDSLKNKLKNYDDVILLTTNDRIVETLQITDDCKEFILNIFTPKHEFKLYFDNYVNNILKLKSDYTICHFRLGDYAVLNNIDDMESFLNKYITNDYISVENDILLTDNKILKKYVLDNNIMVTPNTKIRHVGKEINDDENLDNNDEDYGYGEDEDYGTRDTLVDFFLLLNCKGIKTYTTYLWVSGFVFWASVLKDIQLTILNK
jgi:hypothetical protein